MSAGGCDQERQRIQCWLLKVLYIQVASGAPCIDVHPFPAAMAYLYSSGDKDAVSAQFDGSVCGKSLGHNVSIFSDSLRVAEVRARSKDIARVS